MCETRAREVRLAGFSGVRRSTRPGRCQRVGIRGDGLPTREVHLDPLPRKIAMIPSRLPWLLLSAAALSLVLSACGGGESASTTAALPGSGPSPAPSPTPSPPPTTSASYSIGGSVAGLAGGASVTLLDNNTDSVTVFADGGFVFGSQLASASAYSVTVSQQPAGQFCGVTHGSGTVGSAAVTDIAVNCTAATVSFSAPGATTWTVPAGVSSIRVVATGGAGGGDAYTSGQGFGGNGGVVTSTLAVSPGQVLDLFVGGGGQMGGGTGIALGGTHYGGGSGGGATTVDAGSASQIIAGGGGGGYADGSNGNDSGGDGCGNGFAGGNGFEFAAPHGSAAAMGGGGGIGGAGGVSASGFPAGSAGGNGDGGAGGNGGPQLLPGGGGVGSGGGTGGQGGYDPVAAFPVFGAGGGGGYGGGGGGDASRGGGGAGGSVGPPGSTCTVGANGATLLPGGNGSIVITLQLSSDHGGPCGARTRNQRIMSPSNAGSCNYKLLI